MSFLRLLVVCFVISDCLGYKAFQIKALYDEVIPFAIDCPNPSPPLGPMDGILISSSISLVLDPPRQDQAEEYRQQLIGHVSSYCKGTVRRIFARAIGEAINGSIFLRFMDDDCERFRDIMNRIMRYQAGNNLRAGTALTNKELGQSFVRSMFREIASADAAILKQKKDRLNEFLDLLENVGFADRDIFAVCKPAFGRHLDLVLGMKDALVVSDEYFGNH